MNKLTLKTSRNENSFVNEKTGKSVMIDLCIDDDKEIKVLVHNIDVEPVSGKFSHIDFYAIKMDQEIHTDVPIHLEGESNAVKLLHGILIHSKESVQIKCLPKNLISV